jgi:hypothetical protein
MSLSDDSAVIDQTTRVLQIIVFALVTGLVTFLGVVLFLHAQPKPARNPGAVLPVITVVAFTIAVVLAPLSLIIPRLVSDAARKQIAAGKWAPGNAPAGVTATTDAGRLAVVYQTQKIIGAAMTEGPAFLALIAYMLESTSAALGLALFLIVGVALRFPQRAQVQQWIDDQLGRLDMDRQTV